jgi:epoxyqueuosine reductase
MLEMKEAIRNKALEIGFDAAGFCSAKASPTDEHNLSAFLSRDFHGQMGWMAETKQRRASPKALWPEARSVIVVGLNYAPKGDPLDVLKNPDLAAISAYAAGFDYHDIVKKRLKRLARWIVETKDCDLKVFVDTAPVMEKPLASRAGIGWQGKHTNLVSRTFGSWLFLGEIFTTLDLRGDTPQTDLCGTCERCLKVCPTGALIAPYQIDARRCISYLTIEHDGTIDPGLSKAFGNRVYGCDDCLAVCPWNKFATPTKEAEFLPKSHTDKPRLTKLSRLDEPTFRSVFAKSPIKRSGHAKFLRNIETAIKNSDT